ncbi:MAG: HAD family hydrolase [[Clostridium] innocuum]
MKINAVFFDIDGTFFDHVSGMVLPETLTAVKKLRENGYKVCLCSGRAKEMAEQLGVLQMTAWDGYVGGAGVSVYNERMELISEHAFTREQTARIFELGRQYDICIQSHGTYEFMTKPLNPYARQTFAEFHCKVPEVRDWHDEPLVAISAYEKKALTGVCSMKLKVLSCSIPMTPA